MEKKRENKIFAQGFCFQKIFIFFVIGCLFGTYYEEILWFIKYHEWTNRQGLIYSPLSPIYGVGVLFFVLLLGKKNEKRSIWKTFLYSFLIGGFAEYLTSFIADRVFGVEFWDYSNLFLNINGRTTIPYMIAWGVMGTILMKLIYPFVSRLVEKIPYKIGNIVFYVVFVLVMIDIFLTYSALGRMALRNQGIEPFTFVGELYDQYYTNDFLYDKFPIMRPNDKQNEEQKSEEVVWDGATLIGHSFFGIDGNAYTGSKEAFLVGYDKGIRTFEVDFQFTSDDKLVLIHDWTIHNTFKEVPTEEEFLNTKILGKYTTMSFKDLLSLMEEYPDIFIVTDSKYTDNEFVKKTFETILNMTKELHKEYLLDRFIVQIYHEEMYDIVTNIYPFKNIIFTLYQRWFNDDIEDFKEICKWSEEHHIKAITMMNAYYSDTLMEILKEYHLDVYLHTENDVNKAREFLSDGVRGIYTDTIGEKDIEG